MQTLAKIIFDAIMADDALRERVGGRVKVVCFEVSPHENDNTPLPYIVVRDLGRHPSATTKDTGWLPSWFTFNVGVEIGAKSNNEVESLDMQVMKAVANHIIALDESGQPIPLLEENFPDTQGVAWDWEKPCCWDIIHYQADMESRDEEPLND